MTNNKQQTAVEWLVEQLPLIQQEGLRDIIEQAKVMEMEQIMNDYKQGQYDGNNIRETDAYEYYNLIYGDTK
jgi:hypothetical protein